MEQPELPLYPDEGKSISELIEEGIAEQEAPEPDADLINETFMEHGKEALMEQGMSEDEAEASVREQLGVE